jgi:mRNA interferase MazF
MMKRGEVHWIGLDPTVGTEIQKTRPCVVVSINPISKVRGSVVVVPVTSKGPERLPLVVELSSAKSFAVCDQIRAVSKQRFGKPHSTLSTDDLAKLDLNLKVVLGL